MIQRDEVLSGLMFNLAQANVDSHDDDMASHALYSGVSDMSNAIIKSLKNKDTQNFIWLFALIEKYLREGDPQARELLSHGLIDHLQEALIRHKFKLDALDPWMRRETKEVWQSMIDQWSLNGPQE